MAEYTSNTKKETPSESVPQAAIKCKSSGFYLQDNRKEFSIQKKQKEASENFIQNKPIQKKENNTGLPDNLKTGIENLSGYTMDDVKVHYNSDKPAQLNAHAYAQGTDIHVASGQEKHLPHEAWHVVQQKQGRVKPTMQMKGKVNVNDDAGLEREADVMGEKADYLNDSNSRQMYLNVTLAEANIVQKMSMEELYGTDIPKGFYVFLKKMKMTLPPWSPYQTIPLDQRWNAVLTKFNLTQEDLSTVSDLKDLAGLIRLKSQPEFPSPEASIERDEDIDVPQKMMTFVSTSSMEGGLKTAGAGPCVVVGVKCIKEVEQTCILGHFDDETDLGETEALLNKILSQFDTCSAYVAGGNNSEANTTLFQPICEILSRISSVNNIQTFPTHKSEEQLNIRLSDEFTKFEVRVKDKMQNAERTHFEGMVTIPQKDRTIEDLRKSCMIDNQNVLLKIAEIERMLEGEVNDEALVELDTRLDDWIRTYDVVLYYLSNMTREQEGLLLTVQKYIAAVNGEMRVMINALKI